MGEAGDILTDGSKYVPGQTTYGYRLIHALSFNIFTFANKNNVKIMIIKAFCHISTVHVINHHTDILVAEVSGLGEVDHPTRTGIVRSQIAVPRVVTVIKPCHNRFHIQIKCQMI